MSPLTKDDMIALRTCDKVLIGQDTNQNDGNPFVRCFKEDNRNDVFYSHCHYNSVRDISVASNLPTNAYRCFTNTDSTDDYHGTMKSIIAVIRLGDELDIHWRENNNDYLRDAALCKDECFLHIYRKDTMKYSFMIDVRVCKNNSGRMIRGAV